MCKCRNNLYTLYMLRYFLRVVFYSTFHNKYVNYSGFNVCLQDSLYTTLSNSVLYLFKTVSGFMVGWLDYIG